MFRTTILAAGLLVLPVSSLSTHAEEPAKIAVTIHDDRIDPAELKVKSGQPFVLDVKNATGVAAELESDDLKFEKIIAAGETATIRVRAPKPGRHEIFNEFKKSVNGVIVAE